VTGQDAAEAEREPAPEETESATMRRLREETREANAVSAANLASRNEGARP
jgi:hypothetical protein